MPALNYDMIKKADGRDVHLIFFDTEGWRNGINNHTDQVGYGIRCVGRNAIEII